MTPQKASAATYAYQTMKEWILSGFLLPGSKIDQDEAARKMGLSRMPVRSALDKLAGDGLVIATPHKGAIVTPLESKTLINIYEIRAQIESLGVMWATIKASTEDIENLYTMLDYQDNLSDSSINSVLTHDRNFQRAIMLLARNETLLSIFDNLWEKSERYRRIYFNVLYADERMQPDFRHLIDLMLRRETQLSADYMNECIRKQQDALLLTMGKEIKPLRFKVTYLGNKRPSEG